MSEPQPPAQRSLRVFDIAHLSPEGSFDVEVDLQIAWARRHESLVVGFDYDPDPDFGWHARLVGDEGEELLSFPWFDHADRALGGLRGNWFAPWRLLLTEDFPTTLTEEGRD